ncbi:MAG: ABC transporter substrate-binding protein [Nitrososphaerota archaeon]
MRKYLLIVALILLVSVFSFGAVLPQFVNIHPTATNVKYGGTLKWIQNAGPLTFDMNPFINGIPPVTLIYEPLFYINELNDSITPLLGVYYTWKDSNLKLVVTVRRGVQWSDGTPFTAEDVAFTFNYLKQYPAIDTAGVWSNISDLQSVDASGDTVTFTFSKPNTPLFYYIAGVLIVPEHIWSKIKDPTTYTNPNPVGTGPFLLKSFNASNYTVSLIKNPNYWLKGRPYLDGIDFQSVLTNNADLLYMLKGEYDGTYTNFIDPQTTWIALNPKDHHMYWPTYDSNILYLNTAKYPFNIPTFREAISLAINKPLLAKSAYFGANGYDFNPTGIVPSQQKEWLDPTLTAEASELNTYNPQKAQELLASIGFKKDAAGNLVGPNGKELPTFKLDVGAGWQDYITMGQIMAQELKMLGINMVIDQQTTTYWSSMATGEYDMAICWETGTGPTPYYMYYQEFNPSFAATKIGETAISDLSWYTNPTITNALTQYSSTSDPNVQKQAIYTIEKIVLQDVPFIVLTNRTGYLEYSTARFTGWPSASDQYNIGTGFDFNAGGLVMALNLHLK